MPVTDAARNSLAVERLRRFVGKHMDTMPKEAVEDLLIVLAAAEQIDSLRERLAAAEAIVNGLRLTTVRTVVGDGPWTEGGLTQVIVGDWEAIASIQQTSDNKKEPDHD